MPEQDVVARVKQVLGPLGPVADVPGPPPNAQGLMTVEVVNQVDTRRAVTNFWRTYLVRVTVEFKRTRDDDELQERSTQVRAALQSVAGYVPHTLSLSYDGEGNARLGLVEASYRELVNW